MRIKVKKEFAYTTNQINMLFLKEGEQEVSELVYSIVKNNSNVETLEQKETNEKKEEKIEKNIEEEVENNIYEEKLDTMETNTQNFKYNKSNKKTK